MEAGSDGARVTLPPIESAWLNGEYDSAIALLCAQEPTAVRDLFLAQVYLRVGRHTDVTELLAAGRRAGRLADRTDDARAHAFQAVAFAALGDPANANSHVAAAGSYHQLYGRASVEIALNTALVAWMEDDHTLATSIVSEHLSGARSQVDPYLTVRFFMLRGWLYAAHEQYAKQALMLVRAIEQLRALPTLDVGLCAWALHSLAALARDIHFPRAIALIEDLEATLPRPAALEMARFQASRALAWSLALQGDYIQAFRRLNAVKSLASTPVARIWAHLDHAHIAMISDQDLAARAELDEARDLIAGHDWSAATWEESAVLFAAAELIAPQAPSVAREIFEQAQALRPRMHRNSGFAHDRRLDAIADYTDAVIFEASSDRRLARHRAERAYQLFSSVGYAWRAAQCALLVHEMSGRPEWLERARQHVDVYPRSVYAQAAARREGKSNPVHRLTARERAVFRLALDGQSNDEIAIELKITRNTVRTHISSILRAFGVKDRTHLILEAARYTDAA